VQSETKVRKLFAELKDAYAQAVSPAPKEHKSAHVIALGRMIRDEIDMLEWVLGEK